MQFVNSEIPEGLTFDDVLLVPARSEVLPRAVDVSTKFTRDITLCTPIVSSAMDTVTEADLAIAMARAGGIGVIHKNMTIEQQCEQVRRVKRAENGMIYDPVTISPEATVGDALALMAKHHIGGIPVVDLNGKLIGIVTNRDLRFQDNKKKPVFEVMTKENLVTAKKGISLQDATGILRQSKVEKLPVVDDDFKLVGLITYKDLMKIKDNPIASKDSKGRLLVAAAVGVKSDTLDRIEMLVSAGADAVVIDTAHGHSVGVLDVIAKACAAFKNRDIQIVAGNVATGEGAKALADAGVSAVKVGIGPGSICTTRIIAGVGMPQLTAVMLASKALEGTGVPVIADKISPLPETNIIGSIKIEIRNAIFKKNPCIPKQIPSIRCPALSLILLPISLNIAGGKINPAPAIGIPINANNTKPNLAGIIFPKKNRAKVNIISIDKHPNIIFL